MKATIIGIFVVLLLLSIGNVMALPAGKIEFVGGPLGKVTFDAKVHADKKLKCPDCHATPKLFAMKKGVDKLTMADMNEGKFCGACHNGTKSFGVKVPTDCIKCHKK